MICRFIIGTIREHCRIAYSTIAVDMLPAMSDIFNIKKKKTR